MNYGPGGLLQGYSPPGGGGIARSYAADGRPVEVSRADGGTIRFAYDSAGRIATELLPGGDSVNFGFDAGGNLSEVRSSSGVDLHMEYDGDLQTLERWSGVVSGSVSLTHDADFRPSVQRVNGGSDVQFVHDADGLLTSAGALALSYDPRNGALLSTTLGPVQTVQSYSAFGELASARATFNGAPLHDVSMAYDAASRIATKDEAVGGVTTHYEFAYDSAGRLVTVKRDGLVSEAYEYDPNGNRTRATASNGSVTASYDGRDRLISYGDGLYFFTPDGELRLKVVGTDTTAFTYDALGNLRAVVLPDRTRIDYVVDGSNRRVGKKVNGQLVRAWLYEDQLAPVAELDGAGQLLCRFVYGTRTTVPDYAVCGDATYRIVTDERGSLRLAVDTQSGALVLSREYSSFGVVTQDTRPDFLPFGFAGGLYDPATGLTRFGARDYDATTGRWTARDPIAFGGGDANLYAYVGNDPINRVDPVGLQELAEETFADLIRSILRGTAKEQLKFKIKRQLQCWIIEAATQAVITEGVYLFVEAATSPIPGAANLLYTGMTNDFARRQLEHQLKMRLAGAFRAVFGVEGAAPREAEQFLLSQVRKALGVGEEALLGKGGVSNRRNPLNKKLRDLLGKKFCPK